MSEILGHDCNGKPLRAGDQAVMVATKGRNGDEDVVVLAGSRGWRTACARLRRIDDRTDHQPSQFTYDQLVDHLKSGVPA